MAGKRRNKDEKPLGHYIFALQGGERERERLAPASSILEQSRRQRGERDEATWLPAYRYKICPVLHASLSLSPFPFLFSLFLSFFFFSLFLHCPLSRRGVARIIIIVIMAQMETEKGGRVDCSGDKAIKIEDEM